LEKVKQLKKIWSKKSDFPQTAKKILQKLDLNDFVEKVTNFDEFFKEVLK